MIVVNFIIIKACIVALLIAELLGLSFYLCYKDLVEKSKEENRLTPYSIISIILLNELSCFIVIINGTDIWWRFCHINY